MKSGAQITGLFHSKQRGYEQVIAPIDDNKGKHVAAHKIGHNIIKAHINSYHPSVSHYTRKNAPNRRYLNPDITVRMMYDDFTEKQKSHDDNWIP